MDLISKLCSKALLMTSGRAGTLDAVEIVTREYIGQANAISSQFKAMNPNRAIQSIAVDHDALLKEKLIIRIGVKLPQKVANLVFGVVIYTEGGTPIFGSNTNYHPSVDKPDLMSEGEAAVVFDYFPLWSGRYLISVWLSDIDYVPNALTFEFVSPSTPLNAPDPRYTGPVYLPGYWKFSC